MVTAEECLIEAENYAAAAMMVGGEEGRAAASAGRDLA